MKKIILALGILFLIAGNVQTVQAGELNQYEAEIVSKAKGQFEKDGVKYQTDPVFVQELINYLGSDETDLTAAQRDEVIAAMYANVEQGIADGYLIPVKTQDNEEAIEENNEEAAGENHTVPEENQESKTAEENNEVKTEEEGVEGNGMNQGSIGGTDTDSRNTKQTDSGTEETDGAVTAAPDKTSETAGKDFFKRIRKQPVTKTETDKYNGKITITDEEGNSLLTVDTVVKNTGFNIKRTAAMLTGMGIVLVVCSIAAFRYGFLHQGKEHSD